MVTKPEKYTREFVLAELTAMHKEVLGDLGIFFIGQLFENRDYSRQRFSEWSEKFKNDVEISDTIKQIEELLETRLVTGGLTSALNPTLTIFTLKNKHSWKDKTEVEQNVSGELKTGELNPTLAKGFLEYMKDKTKE